MNFIEQLRAEEFIKNYIHPSIDDTYYFNDKDEVVFSRENGSMNVYIEVEGYRGEHLPIKFAAESFSVRWCKPNYRKHGYVGIQLHDCELETLEGLPSVMENLRITETKLKNFHGISKQLYFFGMENCYGFENFSGMEEMENFFIFRGEETANIHNPIFDVRNAEIKSLKGLPDFKGQLFDDFRISGCKNLRGKLSTKIIAKEYDFSNNDLTSITISKGTPETIKATHNQLDNIKVNWKRIKHIELQYNRFTDVKCFDELFKTHPVDYYNLDLEQNPLGEKQIKILQTEVKNHFAHIYWSKSDNIIIGEKA